MTKKTKNHIKERELEAIEENKKEDKSYLHVIYSLYLRGLKDIQKELSLLYLKYAGKEGLTMEDAMVKVSKKDAKEFSEKAKKYSKAKDFSKRAKDTLGIYALEKRVSRLDLMKRQVLLNTIDLANQEESLLKGRLEDVIKKEVSRQAGLLGMDQATKKEILKNSDEVLYAKFHKARFSDRIWANQRELQRRLERGIDRTILQGENPKAWSKSLEGVLRKEMLDKGKRNARYMADRLAITEASRAQGAIALECFKRSGYEKYIYIAELDHRTCSVCEELDGQVFLVSEALPGANMYPMHPLCRCSTAAYMEEEKENSEDIFTEEEEFTEENGYKENKEEFLQEQLDFIDKHTNEKSFIPKHAIIKFSKTIAKNTEIRELKSLIKSYGKGDWEKKVGNIESEKYIHDVHWYAKDGKQFKVKLKHRKEK